jgi:hypothetical protein
MFSKTYLLRLLRVYEHFLKFFTCKNKQQILYIESFLSAYEITKPRFVAFLEDA